MKKYSTLNTLFACGILIAGFQSANAGTVKEDFNYTIGSFVELQTGGIGWVTAWSIQAGNGSITTETGSLTYPGIISSGGKMYFSGLPDVTGTTTVVNRLTDPAVIQITNGTTTYVSFLAQNLNGAKRYFGMTLHDNGTERMLIGQGSGYTNWTINNITNRPSGVTVDSGVNSSNVALLVLKLEMLTGPERVTFWVNPDLSQPENLATAVGGTNYMTIADFGQINNHRLGGGGYSATFGVPTAHYLDEIRVSSVSPFAPILSYTKSGGNLTLSWPAQHLGWILQAQTNTLSGGTNWVDVLGTDLVTSTNLPINPANSAGFFRLRPPQP